MRRSTIISSFAALILICIFSPPAFGDTTYVSGAVYGWWDASHSPYIVTGDLVVPPSYMLSMGPGVQVLFTSNHRILVDGSLIAAYGTEQDSVVFKPLPGVAEWGSIHILHTPANKDCIFRYTLFEKADGAPEDDRWGGAFYTQYGKIRYEHCKFVNNHAYTGSAIFGHLSTVYFQYCELFRNACDWKGGALNFNTCTVTVDHTAICHNSAVNEAGGIYAWMGNIDLINCTMANNSASDGGGIWNYPSGSHLDVTNSIIFNNEPMNIEGPGTTAAIYSDVGGGWPGLGNIDSNPLFINPGVDNYHLLPESPCIDAGDPGSPHDPDGTRADMGAYYYDQLGPGSNLILDVNPINPPIIIPAQGGSFDYSVLASYIGTGYVVFDYWVKFRLPSGSLIGPYFLRQNLYLSGGQSISRTLTLRVAGAFSPGIYEFCAYAGDYPDTAYATDFFSFQKLAAGDFSPVVSDPDLVLSGWGQEEEINFPSPNSDLAENLNLNVHPQPFNPTTAISFELRAASLVHLKVYDTTGRLVSTLVDGWRAAGQHEATFDATGLAAGVYLYRLETGGQSVSGKMVMLK